VVKGENVRDGVQQVRIPGWQYMATTTGRGEHNSSAIRGHSHEYCALAGLLLYLLVAVTYRPLFSPP